MQEEKLHFISLEEIPLTVKELESKWRQGIGINRVQEYTTLLRLCFASNKSLNFAATRSILYLLKWGMVDVETLLGTLAAIAGETRDVSGVINFLARVILDSKTSNVHNYVRYISHILTMNKQAVFSILSVFDEIEPEKMLEKFRPVINDLLFDANNNRLLPWIKITDKVDVHLHHTFLHWLKYTDPEDCSFAVMSIQKISLGNIQKCFILSSVIYHQMLFGTNTSETINLLKLYIPHVDNQTHCVVVLTVLHGMKYYSKLYLFMIFDLCNWFLDNLTLWNEVLWYMFAAILPFTKKDVFAPKHHLKVTMLIDKINQKITSKKLTCVNSIKSLVLRYTIYRHNCIHESVLLLRLITTFYNKKELLNLWLQKLLHNAPTKRSLEILVTMYFLSGDVTTRKNSLSVISKWNFGNTYIYLYQLNKEQNPGLQFQILKCFAVLSKNKADAANFNKLQKWIQSEEHENSYTLCAELYHHAWITDGKSCTSLMELLLRQGTVTDYVQAVTMRSIAFKLDIYCEELIPLANKIINDSKNNQGTLATALAIDTISIMCKKGFLDLSVLWDQFMRLVAADKHPAVQKSVCNFLSMSPIVIRRSDDTTKVVYRSARLLWHFLTSPSFDKDSAASGLKEYDLEDFDASFLSEQCQSHVKSSIVTNIPSGCWLHIILESNAVDIFIHLINKISKKAKFRGNYSSLFHGIIESLKNLTNNTILKEESDDKNSIMVCLKILGADWTNIPAGKDINFFVLLLQSFDTDISSLSLYVILKLYPMNDMAKKIFEHFLNKKKYTIKDKFIICLLPSQFLAKQREVNMEIIFDGVYHGLCSEEIDYYSGLPFKQTIPDVFEACAKDNACPNMCRRIIMIIMVQVWIKVPFNHQSFTDITKFLAKTYGKPLVKTMPLCSPDYEMCMKYAHLSTEIALDTKTLYGFDLAVRMGLNHRRIQEDVIKCLIKVLNAIGTDNSDRNIKWFIRLLCTVSMHPDNFLCQILVHSASYLSGINMFSAKESLAACLDLFPLAIVKISDMRRIPKNIMLTLDEIIRQSKVHPSFIEMFKIGIMALRDDPNVPFDTVVKKVME